VDLYQQNGSKYYTADFTLNGRRNRKSTKQTTKAKAMEVAAEFYGRLSETRHPAKRTDVQVA
jgi:hypothetical protein